MHNGNREELITLNKDPERKPQDHDEDHIDEENPESEDHEEAIVDEQGKESFPASDPPANY